MRWAPSTNLAERLDIVALGSGRVLVLDGCLGHAATSELSVWSESAESHSGLTAAGIGRVGATAPAIRTDATRWIEPDALETVHAPLIALFDALGTELSRLAYLGLRRFELQFAAYRVGAFYARHYDVFRGERSRRATAIFYPNLAWQTGDGGELEVVIPVDADVARFERVAPSGDRLVIFLSDAVEHAVLPVLRGQRFAFTAWFRG